MFNRTLRFDAGGHGLSIAVLAGGDSAEREVSLETGTNVLAALEAAGHVTAAIDPAHCDLAEIAWSRFDACFIALHGGAGEDGRLQRRLELLRVPYTGSGPDACRLAMSKSASKERFLQAGLPTLDYLLVAAGDDPREVQSRAARLPYPLIAKPDSQGSSLGVGVARTPDELPQRIEQAGKFDPYVLIEPYVQGREFTVTLIGRDVLSTAEIVSSRGVFDYAAKYEADDPHEVRFDLPVESTRPLEALAIGAAEALGTRGLVRVDLRMDEANRPWLLELNAVPGLTDTSLAPQAAARAGLELPHLCERLVRDCLALELSR
ncbi:MAG: D-alanine--D-alanine ligase [Pirellulales bacterium]